MGEQRQVYLMGEGAAEQERLAILSDIYEQGSVRFLRSQLPPDAKTVLDIGCGHGQMSCWLGREYPSMQVIGGDSSGSQLHICDQLLKAGNLSNVRFENLNLMDTWQDRQQVDVLYALYVLMHIPDWNSAFANMLSVCRAGGSILLEEPGFPFVSYPAHDSLNKANEWGQELTKKMGMRFDCIEPLWSYVHGLDGVAVDHWAFDQPFFSDANRKSLLWRSFMVIMDPLVACGMAARKEVEKVLSDLKMIAVNPLYVVGALRMIQLHLVKL